jgi:hypothetical protein
MVEKKEVLRQSEEAKLTKGTVRVPIGEWNYPFELCQQKHSVEEVHKMLAQLR